MSGEGDGDGTAAGRPQFVSWLEDLLSDGGVPSPELALEMADATLDEAHRAGQDGDETAQRYYTLAAGQALGFALTARLHERLLRIEQLCPGLEGNGA